MSSAGDPEYALSASSEDEHERHPDLDSEVAIGVGEEAIRRIVDLTRSFLPAVLATGVATEEEIDIDTLAERLRADTGSVGRVTFWPTVVGAFARKPA